MSRSMWLIALLAAVFGCGCIRAGLEPRGGAGDGVPPDLDQGEAGSLPDRGPQGEMGPDRDQGPLADAPAGGTPAFVLVGVDGRRLVSFDRGATWAVDQADSPLTGDQERWLVGAAWNATRVVLIGGPWNDPGGYLLHSTDGTSWTEAAFPPTQGPLDIAHGNGRFVTVNNVGANCVSTDGITWPATCPGTSADGRGVCFGQGKFFAAGDNGKISTSTDGVTWQTTVLGGSNLDAVACGTDRFVAVNTERRVATTDGLTALSDQPATNGGCCPGVAFGRGLFVDSSCSTTTDGLTWDPPTAPCSLKSVTYGDGVFLGLTAGGQIVRSSDGRTWTTLGSVPAGPDLYTARFVRFP